MMPAPPEPMTIDQLKAHMDRRFDRLARTKADRSELRRLSSRCATKVDLKRFATKVELKAAFGRLEDRIAAIQTMLQRVLDHDDRILEDHEARIADLERRA